ncbi:2-dehydropantoate 2-reductase [Burkholderia sp. Ac-20345]|uniref:2-dehydropantoate 2-reductase n=1 Tax=Burkholderia sp. Ac-20345 TaxID=2703891 RepID=UPI00197BE537|nr:2-dehydropantoate 2-reductase [Burkholderia sp. Ac-20345]MBN3779412.1 2-dehydropantoate 2-reductase [Burkholderia sp. Ac-20345]
MKVLMLGAGAIGGYYGARLIEANADVTFAVRVNRRQWIESNGLKITSALGDFHSEVQVVDSKLISEKYDLVILTCKSYDLHQAIDAIAPAIELGAVVLPFVNGLAAYDMLDQQFGRARVLGGVSYIATTLSADGVVQHDGHSDTVIIGARHPAHLKTTRKIYDLIAKTDGRREYSENIEQALWDKWVTIGASAAVCCLLRGSVGEIIRTKEGALLVSIAIQECTEVARRSGFPLSQDTIDRVFSRLLDCDSTWSPSMMRDIEVGAQKLEADAIVGDMASRARALGIPVILISAAYANLQIYLARKAHTAWMGKLD